MAGVLAFQGYLRVLKDNGDVCADAKAAWYVAGATTPTDTYTTSALSVANANPVEASALGIFPEMWLSPTVSYKVVITGTGVTTRTIDNVYGALTVNQLENDVRYVGVPGGAAYTTTGSSNAYVVSTGLTLTSLPAFSTLLIKASFTNTGPATLNVDGIGAKNIYKYGAALLPGELQSGQIYQVSYDGTQFQLLSASQSQAVSSNPNAIINGDMNIWQRGTSFAAITNGAFFADRWRYVTNSTAVHTITRDTDVPTVAQAGRLFNYSTLVDCTTADGTVGAGEVTYIAQKVEGFNWLPLAQRAIIISFWVKATKTGVYCVSLRNSGNDRSYVGEYTVNTTATWEFKTVTITASPSAGTWDYTTGTGVDVAFALLCGSTSQTTAGAWQTGNFIATANQVNACDSTSNDFRITGVKLEPGSVSTMSQPKIFSDELAECQRYYEKSFPYATAPAQNVGSNIGAHYFGQTQGASAGGTAGVVTFVVCKRVAPTVTTYNPAAANAQVRNVTRSADGASTSTSSSDHTIQINFSSSAGSAVGDQHSVHWDASAEL